MVSPWTTFTLPAKVASFFLSRISSEAASIWIGWSRFCEKPCKALGTPVEELCARAPCGVAASNKAAMTVVKPAPAKLDRLVMKSLRIG